MLYKELSAQAKATAIQEVISGDIGAAVLLANGDSIETIMEGIEDECSFDVNGMVWRDEYLFRLDDLVQFDESIFAEGVRKAKEWFKENGKSYRNFADLVNDLEYHGIAFDENAQMIHLV